jgi:hypothetical protein
VKTSIWQTRFTKKGLRDLKEQFEKLSNWILVTQQGTNVDAVGYETTNFEEGAKSSVARPHRGPFKKVEINIDNETSNTQPQ